MWSGFYEVHGLEEVPSEETARFFVQTWAETVLEQVKAARAARAELDRADRVLEWAERDGEGPTDGLATDVHDLFRKLWTAEHMLVWSAHQLERWTVRLAKERNEEPPEKDERLEQLRNALEHLDKARLEDSYAVAHQSGFDTHSLRKLPNGRILIGWGPRLLFGNMAVDEIEKRALAQVAGVRAELDAEFEAWVSSAEDQWVQQLIDEARGK